MCAWLRGSRNAQLCDDGNHLFLEGCHPWTCAAPVWHVLSSSGAKWKYLVFIPIGSVCMPYMDPHLPSIYPKYPQMLAYIYTIHGSYGICLPMTWNDGKIHHWEARLIFNWNFLKWHFVLRLTPSQSIFKRVGICSSLSHMVPMLSPFLVFWRSKNLHGWWSTPRLSCDGWR